MASSAQNFAVSTGLDELTADLDKARVGAGISRAVACLKTGERASALTIARERTDAAIAAFDRALQLKPNYSEALRAGGAILRDSQRSDQALRFFEESLRLAPDYADASLDAANLLDALDRPAEALEVLDAALR